MKKTLLSLMTLVFLACSFLANAQNPLPVCKLKAKFDFKTERCSVNFTDLSATTGGTTIVSWLWDFGDATSSTFQNPSHTYTTPGTYTVCLTIVGVNKLSGLKCKDKFCLPVTVDGCGQVLPCKLAARFKFKTEQCTVYFADISATGSGTTITNWYWNFGDSTTSTLQNPSHVYAASGTYTVCLVIVGSNAKGEQCKDKFCLPVTVEGCGTTLPCGVKPLFDFKVDQCTAYFVDNSGTNPGTTITSWYWNFGDGNTSTLQNPIHTYAANATYTVCLTVYAKNTNGEECKNTYCFPVKIDGCGQVEPCGVKPLFDFKVDKCIVYFADNTGTNSGTTITSWYWDFGDGNTSVLQNPTHSYAANGTYTVCLTVYAVNAAGVTCKNTYCRNVTIEGCGTTEPCKVGAKFSYKLYKCDVYFNDFSASGAGTTITNWYWNFGDGNTSTLQNPSHTYAANGIYKVCLTVVGLNSATGEQCKDTYCEEIKITDCGQGSECLVSGKFDYKADKCTLYFTDYSAASPGTIITYWEWNFGDGSPLSNLQNPTHAYAAPGTYVVCLIIVGTNSTTGEQCKDKVCQEVIVKECDQNGECLVYPKFDYKADNCDVHFTDFSATASGTTITNWYWEFGDGSTSTLQNPVHTYAVPGTYEVCLIVVGKNAAGQECKDRICLKVTVLCKPGITGNKVNISSFEVYPNPASDMVNIGFKMAAAGQVNITITDIQGRILSVVQDGQLAAGFHKLNWNINVHSGLYFITIKTDAGVEQKRITINN